MCLGNFWTILFYWWVSSWFRKERRFTYIILHMIYVDTSWEWAGRSDSLLKNREGNGEHSHFSVEKPNSVLASGQGQHNQWEATLPSCSLKSCDEKGLCLCGSTLPEMPWCVLWCDRGVIMEEEQAKPSCGSVYKTFDRQGCDKQGTTEQLSQIRGD